jgi:hypothetical protein
MPKYKKTRSREVEEENRRKKSLGQEEGKVMEAPGGEIAAPSPMAGDPVALLTNPQMAHPANAPLRAQAMTELQRRRGNIYVQQVMERVQAEKGSGRPLEPEVRAEMESAFGQDFGDVRVHTDAMSDRLARELGARAFTTGAHIFIRSGESSPRSSEGKRLLGHELAHVVQQQQASLRPGVSRPNEPAEQEANQVAMAVVRGEKVERLESVASVSALARLWEPLGPEWEEYNQLRRQLESQGWLFTVTRRTAEEGELAWQVTSPSGATFSIDRGNALQQMRQWAQGIPREEAPSPPEAERAEGAAEGAPVPLHVPPAELIDFYVEIYDPESSYTATMGLTGPVRISGGRQIGNRVVIYASGAGIVFQDLESGRIYVQDPRYFVSDIHWEALAEAGRRAYGMVILARAEIAFLKGVLGTVPGLRLAITLVEFLRIANIIHRHWDQILVSADAFLEIRAWMQENAPQTYDYIFWTVLREIAIHLPEGIDVEVVAGMLGAFLGGLGSGTLRQGALTLRVVLQAMGGALTRVVVGAPAGLYREITPEVTDIRERASQLVTEFSNYGWDIGMDAAEAMAREFLSSPELPTRLEQLAHALELLAGLAAAIEADLRR